MIQIDISMPKCCDECFALDEHGDYPFCLISQDQRGYTFNTHEKRMPTCPLKEVEALDVCAVNYDGSIILFSCRACNTQVLYGQGFCHMCGKQIKWNN